MKENECRDSEGNRDRSSPKFSVGEDSTPPVNPREVEDSTVMEEDLGGSV